MIPILAYHQIVDDDFDVTTAPVGDRPYCLPMSAFEAQMNFLAQQDYSVLPLESLAASLAAHRLPKRSVVITFDDGHISNYTRAFPLLRARGWTATFFVVTNRVGQSEWLNWLQMREMQRSGMTIGSHTVSHPFLSQLSLQEIRWELEQSKKALEEGLRTPITTFAVPYGYEPAELAQVAAACGYRAVCNSRLGLVKARTNPLRLPRVTIRRGCSLATFSQLVQGNAVTLCKLKAFEMMKSVGKRGLGLRRWLAVREFLLSLKR
ncbi:MAG: polysaccharide deacetylase family protein [Abditibacteriales bacterium]|nr:polysaccharide deacetylase family protein [Abditibacteriales bacterium]MDW8365687.1 polysaccharide deacetylase family protein [Abditibacteriales bacterium]